jgi:hypothetical protein
MKYYPEFKFIYKNEALKHQVEGFSMWDYRNSKGKIAKMADYIFERPDGYDDRSAVWKKRLISLQNDDHKTRNKKYARNYSRKLQLKMEERENLPNIFRQIK